MGNVPSTQRRASPAQEEDGDARNALRNRIYVLNRQGFRFPHNTTATGGPGSSIFQTFLLISSKLNASPFSFPQTF